MPVILIPETGTGVPGANTYATRTQGDAYHDARLKSDAWDDATDLEKDKALLWATQYLDANTEWLGSRQTLDQPLAWPRTEVEWQGFDAPEDWMPPQVVRATCELARLLIEQDLQAEQTGDGIANLGLGSGALDIQFKEGNRTRRMPLAIGEILQGIGTIPSSGGIQQRKTFR
jgi:methylase of polypeptide subunit release factors